MENISTNEAAFLAVIRHSEGTDRAKDPYRVIYGYTLTLQDLSDHPAITGEWLGVQTKWGHTSAAGAYQIERLTWLECQAALGLNDFTPESQDQAALFLIGQKGGLALINAGQFTAAIAACREIWASLPGGDSGQPQAKLAALQTFYANAGGALA